LAKRHEHADDGNEDVDDDDDDVMTWMMTLPPGGHLGLPLALNGNRRRRFGEGNNT